MPSQTEVDARTTGRSARGQDGPYRCNLAVDEARQRKGIASALVQYCELQDQQWHCETLEDDVEVAKSLYLKVRETNQAAVSMYDKLGYRSYQQEKDNKGTTVLVMRKELPKVVKVPQQQHSQDQEKNQVEKERKRNTQVYYFFVFDIRVTPPKRAKMRRLRSFAPVRNDSQI
jgi:hypothetical protein